MDSDEQTFTSIGAAANSALIGLLDDVQSAALAGLSLNQSRWQAPRLRIVGNKRGGPIVADKAASWRDREKIKAVPLGGSDKCLAAEHVVVLRLVTASG